ncbi:SOSS complex subunit C [Austrofundulus limnaeus]|uniref:SOSS complex subunit C n=1 Tax=Austrofundulus limnaeus TaxID=52670 RepID=A0A2I4AQS4_AUSLI|nr:PREDICTED: SOSS complex subunit C [Austrofundulus limnaeus]
MNTPGASIPLSRRNMKDISFTLMAANPPGQAFSNNARAAILVELKKEKDRLIQNRPMNTPGASIPLSRRNMKDFRDSAELQHIAAQQKTALQHAHALSSGFFITQDSSFGNLILPVLPRLEQES